MRMPTVLCVVLLCCRLALASARGGPDEPKPGDVDLPAGSSAIWDTAGMFSGEAVRQGLARLRGIEGEHRVPVTIETIGSLGGEPIEKASRRYCERLGPQAKGVYILIAKDDHKLRALASKGYSKLNVVAKLVAIQDVFVADFRKGDFDAGLRNGVEFIGKTIASSQEEDARGGAEPGATEGLAKALPRPDRAGSAPTRRVLGEKYALLIGVREYDVNELHNLKFPEADVVELSDVLRQSGYRRVVLMTQTEGAKRARLLPLASNIRAELRGILEDRSPEDTLLVAFAGHGVQFQGDKGSFFCPMDARLADRKTLISIDEVYRELERSAAGVKVLLVDACRDDPRSNDARGRDEVELESVSRPQAAPPPGGVVAIFSCSEREKAFENDQIKHGVFFHFLIRGLRGEADLDRDGSIEVEELALFVKRRVSDFVRDVYGAGVRQMPVLLGEIRGLPVLSSGPNARDAGLPEVQRRP